MGVIDDLLDAATGIAIGCARAFLWVAAATAAAADDQRRYPQVTAALCDLPRPVREVSARWP